MSEDCRKELYLENLTRRGFIKPGEPMHRIRVKLAKIIRISGSYSPITIIARSARGIIIKAEIYRRQNFRNSKEFDKLRELLGEPQKTSRDTNLRYWNEYNPDSLEGFWLKGKANYRTMAIRNETNSYDQGYEFDDRNPIIIADKKPICPPPAPKSYDQTTGLLKKRGSKLE